MNFLAHAHLSGNNKDVLFGNFVADAIKGNGYLKFREDIQIGIKLHRRIDSFTDNHPVWKRSAGRLRSDFGRYSGVVVDIYYDHYLANNWPDYSSKSLDAFAAHVYQILHDRYEMLPDRTKKLLPYLTSQNWLVGYANLRDLQLVFFGMDRRTGLKSGMSKAVEVLKKNYKEIKADFIEYYPDLLAYADQELKALISDKA